MSYGLLTACERDGSAVCTVKNSGVGQRNCPKHVEFYSKNKLEKLVHLVGFIIRTNHDSRSSVRQMGADASEGFSVSIFSVEVPYPRKPILIPTAMRIWVSHLSLVIPTYYEYPLLAR